MTGRTGIILALFLASCSAPDIPDIPPLAVGSGFMTDTSNPPEAYATAHARLTSLHVQLEHFTKQPVNTYSATITAGQLVECIATMQALIEEPKRSALQPILEWYREVKTAVEWGRFGGSYAGRLPQYQQRLRSEFSPSQVTFIAAMPTKTEGAGTGTTQTPTGEGTKPPVKTDPPQPVPGDVPLWMLFNAWKQSHADLVEAFTKKADAPKAWKRVREAVAALRGRIPGDKQKKLLLAEATYEQQHEETKGFTVAPAGGKDDDVLRVLRLVGEMIETEYNPDKK